MEMIIVIGVMLFLSLVSVISLALAIYHGKQEKEAIKSKNWRKGHEHRSNIALYGVLVFASTFALACWIVNFFWG